MANEKDVKNSPFGFGQANDAYAQYFIGNSYLNPLASSQKAAANVSNVTFEPGCRNNWHKHDIVQILIAVSGRGWYQEKGQPARELKPGDVVIVDPNTEHWHGAAKDSWFQHLAIMVGKGSTEWLSPVTDEEYDKLD